jgi:hypothetical protein
MTKLDKSLRSKLITNEGTQEEVKDRLVILYYNIREITEILGNTSRLKFLLGKWDGGSGT